MAKAIQDLLNHKTIMKVVEAVKGGVPDGILDAGFFNPTGTVEGYTGEYTKVTSNRQVAQLAMYGSPSKAKKLKGTTKVAVTLMHAYEHFLLRQNTVAKLISADQQEQLFGATEVGRETAQFIERYRNLRRAAVYCVLGAGKLCFDAEWNLCPPESAEITIDFGLPAANKDQLGGIIAAKWSATATDIATQVIKLKRQTIQSTGYKITTAYYGVNVPGYLASNATMKEYLKLNPQDNNAVRNGEIPDGFLGLKWRPAYEAFYEGADGSNNLIWGDDQITFTPDISDGGWWGFLEGSYNVPTDIGKVHGDAMAALASLKKVYGMFSYATVADDPVSVKQYAGDTFLPLIAVPNAVYIADVHWS